MSMIPNVGGVDRMLRLGAGVVLLALAFVPGLQVFGTGVWAWVGGVAGFVLVATGLMRMCLLYNLLGIDTNSEGQTR